MIQSLLGIMGELAFYGLGFFLVAWIVMKTIRDLALLSKAFRKQG